MSIPTAKQSRSTRDQALIIFTRASTPEVPLSDDFKDKIVKWYYEDQETMKEIAMQARLRHGAQLEQSLMSFSTANMANSRMLLDHLLDMLRELGSVLIDIARRGM